MIQSFRDTATEDVFHGKDTKSARAFDRRMWKAMRLKLDLLNAAHSLNDLRVPPSNHLEALKHDQAGRHSIRVNQQYRLTFRFADGQAHEVRCEDYH